MRVYNGGTSSPVWQAVTPIICVMTTMIMKTTKKKTERVHISRPPPPLPPQRYEWILCLTPAFTHWYKITPASGSLHATALSSHAAFVCVCEELNPTAHIYSLYNSTSSSAPVSDCSARTATPRLCTPAPRRSRFHHLSCVSADVPRWFWVSAVRCCCLTPCCFRVCCQRSARGWWWRDEVEITENTHSRVPSCTALRLPPSRSSLTLSLKGTCCTKLCLKINRVCVHTTTLIVKIHPLLFF